jgi:3-deoxy-D-manno-octulosonic-acid transferase
MLWLYRLLFLPALVVLTPYYLLRMRRRGGYSENFWQRFGAIPPLPPRWPGMRRVWVQAVSVGEMLAIAPILEALTHETGVEIYLTTTTSTGYQLAVERYSSMVTGLGYFPIDWWLFSRRAWRELAPDLVILTEGERWPEHIHQAKRRNVPVICINARVSDRSFRRMHAVRFAIQPLLGGITRLLTGTLQDAERFKELGFPEGKVAITGSIKLDVRIPTLRESEANLLRRELGLGEGLVLLGSSTWPGEEAALLEVYKAARAARIPLTLLLVPRHAERRDELDAWLARTERMSYHLRSRGPAPGPVEISIGDTTGELRKFTQLADLVFVGKSLPPHTEGQTPVEAAALGKPIVFGPGMSNFRQIANELVASGAAQRVDDVASLRYHGVDLLADKTRREKMAEAAQEWHRANQGAVERTLLVIRQELAKIARS